MVKYLIKLENFTIFTCAIYLYKQSGGSNLMLFLLFMLPDIAIFAYPLGKKFGLKIGHIIYNLFHTYSIIFLMLFISWVLKLQTAKLVMLIFIAHIAIDRLLGFGLKYKDGFKNTHLNRL